MRSLRSSKDHILWMGMGLALLLLPVPAGAGDLYLSGNLGFAVGVAESGGFNTFGNFANSSGDTDSSPVYGGAVGFAFPLDAAVGREVALPSFVPWRIEVPSWDVRVETEAMGGQDDEFTTTGFNTTIPYHSKVESWTILQNLWLDIPVGRSLSNWFGRVPLLDPLTLEVGGGLGYGNVTASTTDSIVAGRRTQHNLVYQAGAGLGYGMSERVTLRMGYRYLDRGKAKMDLFNGVNSSGNFSLDLVSHEVGASIRVSFYSVPFPGNSRFSRREW